MSKISALLATVLLGFLVWKLTLWSVLPSTERFWTAIASIYVILLAVTGWSYVAMRHSFFGWFHAMLMFGITGVGAYFGFHILTDLSIAGGSGPDANPVAGVFYAIGLLYCVLGIVTAICGSGVIFQLMRKDSASEPVA